MTIGNANFIRQKSDTEYIIANDAKWQQRDKVLKAIRIFLVIIANFLFALLIVVLLEDYFPRTPINDKFANALLLIFALILCLFSLVIWSMTRIKRDSTIDVESLAGWSLTRIFYDWKKEIFLSLFVILSIAIGMSIGSLVIARLLGRVETGLFIGVSVSGLSMLVTILAAHYAFLAERKSEQLLTEKGKFVRGFSPFLRRTTALLKRLYRQLEEDRPPEHEFFWVKCLYLTPVLGHAGLQPNDLHLWKDVRAHEAILRRLAEKNCFVTIVTLSPNQLKEWYAQIQWVSLASKRMRTDRQLPADDLLEQVTRRVVRDKFLDGMRLVDGSLADSLRSLLHERAELFQDRECGRRFEMRTTEGLPFQMCIVSRLYGVDKPDRWPELDAFKVDEYTQRPDEHMEWAIVTFVGSGTYERVVRDIQLGRHVSGDGMDALLKGLHSGMLTEDSTLCEILNTHYWHMYWHATASRAGIRWQYPEPDVNTCTPDFFWLQRGAR